MGREEVASSGQNLGFILRLMAAYRLALAAGVICLLAVDGAQLFIPRVIRAAVDDLSGNSATPASLLGQAGLIFILGFIVFVCRYGWRRLLLGASRRMECDLRGRIYDALLGLDAPFFHKNPSGEIIALASNDLTAVQLAFGMGLVALLDAVVMTLACIGFMVTMHLGLTLIAILPLPFLAVATWYFSARIHRRFAAVQKCFAGLSEFGRQSIAAIRLVKAAGIEARQEKEFDCLGREYVRDNVGLAMVQGLLFPLSTMVAGLCLLMVLYFGGRLVVAGVISVGTFVAFISYLFMLTWPMMAFGWVTNLFQRGMASLNRISRIIDSRPRLGEPDLPLPLPSRQSGVEIVMKDLVLTSGEGVELLKGIDLAAGPGLLGIVGPTGSGKSLLAAALCRVLPVADGSLFINGVDVNRLSLTEYRAQIAFVPQHSLLFADTIYANIAFARPGAGREEVEEAARLAVIHEEIMAMEFGYQTHIGERGVSLSGGQVQRIALARALLADRPVLVIDDGLSAVDTATEQAIVNNLQDIFHQKTCLVISHRLAVLPAADLILVLADGEVSCRGSHEELLAECPYYARVAAWQSAGCGGPKGGDDAP